jgi:hypothetical protein
MIGQNMRDRKGIVNANFPTVRLKRFQSPEGWMGPIWIVQSITNGYGTTVFWLVMQIILVPVERQLGGTFLYGNPMRRQIGPIILACSQAWSADADVYLPTKDLTTWLFLFKYYMVKSRHSEGTQSKQWTLKIWQVQHRSLPRSCDTQHCS